MPVVSAHFRSLFRGDATVAVDYALYAITTTDREHAITSVFTAREVEHA